MLELNAKDHYDLLLEQMGMSAQTPRRLLKAPMPARAGRDGAAGQTVVKGEGLSSEAMKMENMLKAEQDGGKIRERFGG